jgi:hypothetical protein
MAFLDHPRQVLDRDRLLDMVQGREAHLFDRAVDNQISRLRRKIEIDSRNPQLIQTVWGGATCSPPKCARSWPRTEGARRERVAIATGREKPFLRRIPLWPHSLMGQMLLAIALALFVAQGLSAYLIWREQHERHLAGMVNSTAMRMLGERMAMRHGFSEGMHPPGPPPGFPPGSPPPDLQPLPSLPGGLPPEERLRLPRTLRFHVDSRSPEQPGDIHMAEMEKHLRQVLESQGEQVKAVLVVERDPARDALVGPVLPALRARFDTSTGEGYPGW